MTAYVTAACCAVLAIGAAVLLRRWLLTHGYRYEDEAGTPARRHRWVLAALPIGAFVVTLELGFRWPEILAVAYAVALVPLTALAAIDMDVHRLPDILTYPLVPLALVVALVATLSTGDWSALLRAALGGLALCAAYFILLLISRGAAGLGLGDVKLAAGTGILLGWFSWYAVFGGTVAAFLLSGVWAAGLLITRRATRHSYIAFGPFMVAGTVLVLLAS
ncbi:prepilin peptidase [Leekyejoonella antrihumi]|uniref:Prepilin peptidase n=1 Tax=Leekyejoonella antrihumi TaxID=1660198 RepID=A0A563E069_9MICO|nr:A24 family peptidase [Leekyejoonella antrihumi]TWP35938.1 prepilin peptidase [Leekyejoonella antrihumi]